MATDLPPVAPWETMIKKDKREHLLSGHGQPAETRLLAEQLDDRHDQAHTEMAQAIAGLEDKTDRWVARRAEQARERAHTHTSQPISEQEAATVKRVMEGLPVDKVLPSSERNVLSSLINNDFDALKNEMRQMAADSKAERLRMVDAEWAARRDVGPAYVDQVREVWQTAYTTVERLVEEAKANGVTLITASQIYRSDRITFEATGEADAKVAAIKEVDTDLNRAVLSLERQRLAALRIVALSGVTKEAQVVLDQVPNARDLMITAAQERVAKQIESEVKS